MSCKARTVLKMRRFGACLKTEPVLLGYYACACVCHTKIWPMYQAARGTHRLTIFAMVLVGYEMESFPSSMDSTICVGGFREEWPGELAQRIGRDMVHEYN